jgi:glycosyltransferase involved in cell wall biosynthesis
MKILHVIHRFVDTARRGSELYTYVLGRSMADRHDVAVLYTSPKTAAGRVESGEMDGLQTFILGCAESWEQAKLRGGSRQAESAFTKVLREWKPDVVHFQHLLYHSLRLPTIAARTGVASLMTLHDFWLLCPQINLLDHQRRISWPINRRNCVVCCEVTVQRQHSWRRLWGWDPTLLAGKTLRAWHVARARPRQVNRVFRDIGLFIAPSKHLRDCFAEEGLSPSKVVHCGNGINHDLRPMGYAPRRYCGGRLRCGFIGTIAAHKGIDVLLEAFEGIEEASLAVYGAAKPHYISRVSARNVRFMGEISDAQKAKAFEEMDVLIVPSIWFENHPLAMVEASLFGVPIIASNIGGMAELVEDGKNGLLFKVGDAADLRSKVEYLARNPNEVRRLAANVPRVKSSVEHSAEIESLYERVLSGKRGG